MKSLIIFTLIVCFNCFAAYTPDLLGRNYLFPSIDGTSGQALVTNGSGILSWGSVASVDTTDNYRIATSVASNALTISLKNPAGNDPSVSNPVYVKVPTSTDGSFTTRTITTPVSLVISSGSTLGHISGRQHKIWLYLIDSDGAGTMKLVATTTKIAKPFTMQTTVAEGGAGGADTNNILYSNAAYTNKFLSIIGFLYSAQTTAGTYTNNPNKVIGKEAANWEDVIYAAYSTDAGTSFSDGVAKVFICEDRYSDTHNAYDPTTGIFTAPTDGLYQVTFHYSFSSMVNETGTYRIQVYGSRTLTDYYCPIDREASNTSDHIFTTVVYLQAGGITKVTLTQQNGGTRTLISNGGYNAITINRITKDIEH